MEIYRRTVYGSAVQTAQLLGIDLPALQHTTLNEKFNINASATLGANEVPRLKYFTLGIKGHKAVTDANGLQVIENVEHSAEDAALYHHLPFAVRPLTNDLPAAQMAKYALRRVTNYHGTDYAEYYLMRFSTAGSVIKYKKKTVVAGVATVTDFVPDASVLNPTPPVTPPGHSTSDGKYVYCTATVKLVMSAEDVAEAVNAAKIIYGHEKYAYISELGLCTGVDRTMQATGPSGTFNMNEAVCAQVLVHVAVKQALYDFTGNGLTISYDLGISEPLMLRP